MLVHAVSKYCHTRSSYLMGIITLEESVQEYLKQVYFKYPTEERPEDDKSDDENTEVGFCSSCVGKDQLIFELNEKLQNALMEQEEKTEELSKVAEQLNFEITKDISDESTISALNDSVKKLTADLTDAQSKVQSAEQAVALKQIEIDQFQQKLN